VFVRISEESLDPMVISESFYERHSGKGEGKKRSKVLERPAKENG